MFCIYLNEAESDVFLEFVSVIRAVEYRHGDSGQSLFRSVEM